MNNQPEIIQGYYMHYKKEVYRLIKFATTDNLENQTSSHANDLVIYQPQYETKGIPDYILWARPSEMFFQNININELQLKYSGPRFAFLGKSEEEAMQTLNAHNIETKPHFKKTSMLNQSISYLVFGNYAIQAFAIHSETKRTLILYNKNGTNRLMALPEDEFFRMSQVNPEEKSIAKYLTELKDAEKILK